MKAFKNTDLPPPIGATPKSIHAVCSEEFGRKGMILPSCVLNINEPSFHGEAERKGNIEIASSSGAMVIGEGEVGIRLGIVVDMPYKGSPIISEVSVVPQPCTAFESSEVRLLNSFCAECVSLSNRSIQVVRHI